MLNQKQQMRAFLRQGTNSSVSGILAKIFRTMRDSVTSSAGRGPADSSVYMFSRMLNEYVNDPVNGSGETSVARSQERNNLARRLENPEMSWKLLFRGFRVLQLTEVEIIIRGKDSRGNIHTAVESITISQPTEPETDEQ